MAWQNRIIGAGTEDPEKLIPHPKNWRKHPKGQAQALEGAIEEIGWIQDIIINQRTGRMIDGHLRAELAIKNKEKSVPVKYVDLSEEEEEKALLTLDPISMMAEADKDRLSALLQSITSDNEKVNQLLEDIGREYKVSTKKAKEDDYTPPPEIETDIKRGDIFQLGRHRVMCGDSTSREDVDRLMQGKKATAGITDPPYNVSENYYEYKDDLTESEYEKNTQKWFSILEDQSETQIITPGCNNLARWCRYFNPYHIAPWIKTNSLTNGKISRFWCWEPILFFGKIKRSRGNDVFDYPIGSQKETYGHPCPKPLKFWSDLIENYSIPRDMIFDPFLGSGTTLIACEQLDRICYGMEISPQYCEVICQRWEKFTGQTRIKIGDLDT